VVDILKTGIISGLTFRGLSNTNSEDDKIELLDNLQSFFEEPDASLLLPSTNQGTGTDGAVPVMLQSECIRRQ
jgi:hypothetical protein